MSRPIRCDHSLLQTELSNSKLSYPPHKHKWRTSQPRWNGLFHPHTYPVAQASSRPLVLEKTVKGNTMTALMDDALDAIPRQLSIAYKPTVQEPLPKELKDLLLQFVASEMRH